MAKTAGSFKPGERPTGRQAGTKNRVSINLRESFLSVYEEMQENPDFSLKEWAQENLTEFYKLISKLLPQEYTGSLYSVFEVNLKHETETDGDEENDFG